MRIVVAFDGTPVAHTALDLARRLATAMNAKIFLTASVPADAGQDVKAVEMVARDLERACRTVQADGSACETRLVRQSLSPGEDVVALARDIEADEIVMGVRQRSRVGKLVFGSTAQYVILEAPCPVITVK